MKTYVTFCRIL